LDFIAIIRSLEELLYEVMTWLIFYPRTLFRIIVSPTHMTLYSDDEQDDTPADRYSDALSPPLLLMLTLLICHVVELGFGLSGPKGHGSAMAKTLIGSDQALLLTRALLFAVIPVTIAGLVLRIAKRPLDRKTLRMPFYAQCYLVVPFALVASIGGTLVRAPGPGTTPLGAVLAAVAFGWFIGAESHWMRRQLGLAPGAAAVAALACVAAALLACLLVATLLALTL
jgi:hypothetical protein